MTPEQRNKLEEKKAQLQVHMRFNEFVQDRIVPFLDILNELYTLQINHRVVLLRCIPQEFHELLREYIQTETLAKYQLAELTITTEDTEVETILEKYPSANPFRYVLDAPIVGYGNQPDEVFQELVETHKLAEGRVFICWLKYAFLLEVDFKDLVQKANDELFNSWHDDTIIFSKDNNWLIAYSLEDEWRFGRQQ